MMRGDHADHRAVEYMKYTLKYTKIQLAEVQLQIHQIYAPNTGMNTASLPIDRYTTWQKEIHSSSTLSVSPHLQHLPLGSDAVPRPPRSRAQLRTAEMVETMENALNVAPRRRPSPR